MANYKVTLNDVINAVTANMPNLQRDVDYTLEQLTGHTFWASLSSGQRKGLGIQFKAYSRQPGAIVTWTGSTPTHTQRYQLI